MARVVAQSTAPENGHRTQAKANVTKMSKIRKTLSSKLRRGCAMGRSTPRRVPAPIPQKERAGKFGVPTARAFSHLLIRDRRNGTQSKSEAVCNEAKNSSTSAGGIVK